MQVSDQLRENTEEQAAIFSAFADPTRLRLVKLLARQHHPNALCVNALARFLEVSQSAVSQHLRVLKGIGLVRGERRGYRVHYFVNEDVLNRFREIVSIAMGTAVPTDDEPCPGKYHGDRRQHVPGE